MAKYERLSVGRSNCSWNFWLEEHAPLSQVRKFLVQRSNLAVQWLLSSTHYRIGLVLLWSNSASKPAYTPNLTLFCQRRSEYVLWYQYEATDGPVTVNSSEIFINKHFDKELAIKFFICNFCQISQLEANILTKITNIYIRTVLITP